MTDTKKFWLVATSYLVAFWGIPLCPWWIDEFFTFFNKLWSVFQIDIEFFFVYYLIIVPVFIWLIYRFMIKDLQIKFKKSLFVLLYILLPYIVTVSYVFYAYVQIVSNFRGLGSW